MTRPVTATLSVVACLLAATVAWELGGFPARQPADVPPPRAPATTARPTEPDHTAAWVNTILARPLFSPDRRPASLPAADAGGQAVSQGLPRLTGVLVGPFGRNAIFAMDGRKPLVVTEGGKVDAWTVQSIAVGSVKVRGPGGAVTLRPSFEPPPAATTGSSSPGGPGSGLSLRR